MVTRRFTGRHQSPEQSDRIPPGQHLIDGFPVLSAGPTPKIALEKWAFTLKVGSKPVMNWNWAEFNVLPATRITRDIHCVTSWSKLNTPWEGVLIDDILAEAGIEPPTAFVLAHSYDGYSTNVPLGDLAGGRAMVALRYDGQPLEAGSRRTGAVACPSPLFLEVGQMVEGAPVHRAGRSRLLGASRLPHLRRPLARATIQE